MATFNSGYVADDARGLGNKNVGLKISSLGVVGTITNPAFDFGSSSGSTIKCFVQASDGTIQQIGSDYVNSSSGTHTFTGSTASPVNDSTFIVFVAVSSLVGSPNVRVQYSGSTAGTGTEVATAASTLTPNWSDWSDATAPGTPGVPLSFDYSAGGTGGTLLPPPVAWI